MKFVCDFVHPKTHERRTIVVELDNDEIADAQRNLGIDGPVAKIYTLHKASRCVPAGFDPDLREHYARAIALMIQKHAPPRRPRAPAAHGRPGRMAARLPERRYDADLLGARGTY